MSIKDIHLLIEKAFNKYNDILYLIDNKIYNPINNRIDNNILDFENIKQILLNHLNNLSIKKDSQVYIDWCNDTINSIHRIIQKLKDNYEDIKNYKNNYLTIIKSIINNYTKQINTDITTKINMYVEWYQIIDNNNNYKKIYEKLIKPLLYPNLYPINNRKLLLYGPKDIGKLLFAKAIVTNLVKININYKVILFESDNIIYNGEFVSIEKLIPELIPNSNLLILVDNLNNNQSILKNNYILLEKYNPIWIITNNEIDSDISYDIILEFTNLSQESISSYVNSFLSDYLINDNPYYNIYEPFKTHIYSDDDIIKKLSKLYQSRYKFLCEYDISILENINLIKTINGLIYKKKLNIKQISTIISNSIMTLGAISIKHNTFFHSNNNYVSTLSSNKLLTDIYYLKKPEYDEISLSDKGSGKLCNKCSQNCNSNLKYIHLDLIPNILKLEDDRISDFYILEDQINTLNKSKCIELICKLDWTITNKLNYEIYEYNLSKICLNIYVYYIHYLLSEEDLLNDKDLLKYREKFKQINQLSDLDSLTHDQLVSYFQPSLDLNKLLSKCSKEHQYIIIYTEDLESRFHLKFDNKASSDLNNYKDGIELNINIEDLKEIILYLISDDNENNTNEVQIINTEYDNIYIWEIDFYSIEDNENKIRLDIGHFIQGSLINTNGNIEIGGYISIPSSIFQLDNSYKIMNEHDVDLLQQEFPDFSNIDREDNKSWVSTNLEKKHIDYLNSRYNSLNKFLLYLYNCLFIYKQGSNTNNNNLDILLNILKSKIYERLEIDISDENDNINWNITNNHFDILYPNKSTDLSNIKISMVFLTKLMKSFRPYRTMDSNELINMWDLVNSIDKNRYTKRNINMYIKSHLKLNDSDINKCYYSHYCADQSYEDINPEKYIKFNKVLLHKISNNSSLLFLLLSNTDSIGFKAQNNNIDFYPINKNNWLTDLMKNNTDLVFPDINGIIDNSIYKSGFQNIVALLYSNIYSNSYNTNPTNIYIAALLSYQNYITHKPNLEFIKNNNIFDYINNDILNNMELLDDFFTNVDLNKNINNSKNLIENKSIATGSLIKKSNKYLINQSKILDESKLNQISSSYLRAEYILDELL